MDLRSRSNIKQIKKRSIRYNQKWSEKLKAGKDAGLKYILHQFIVFALLFVT